MSTYSENKDIIQSLKKAVEDAVKKARDDKIAELLKENPKLADYGVKLDVYSYKKRPKGFQKFYKLIGISVATAKNALLTQKELLAKVQPDFPDFKIPPSIWQAPLTPYQKKAVQKSINGSMPNPIKIFDCETLSDVKNKLKAELNKKAAVKSFAVKMVISSNMVTIGKKNYPITEKKASSYSYKAIRVDVEGKRQWVRTDVLLALLEHR